MSDEATFLRLHPLSPLVNLLPRLGASVRSLWPLALAWLWGRASGEALFDVFLVCAILVPAVFGTFAHWATLRYRVADGQLEIESGVLSRTRRTIGRDRVQNVEIVRNLFHRLAGLAEVRVETASGTEVEGLLSALSLAEADALVLALRPGLATAVPPASPGDGPDGGDLGPAAPPTAAAPPPTVEVLAQPTALDLLWTGATGLRLATVGVGLWLAFQLVAQRAGSEAEGVRDLTSGDAGWRSVGLVALVAAGGFWVSVGGTFLRHAGFVLRARGDRLEVEEGLLTRRRTELPRDRVQLVTFEQGFVRRQLGFGTLSLETAAARTDGDGTERVSARVPWVDAADAPDLVRRVLRPATDPRQLELRPPHPSAGWRAAWPVAAAATVGAALATAALGPPGALTLLAAPVAAAQAWLGAQRQGWAVTDDLVAARTGLWSRRTLLVPRPKIQSVATSSTPLLARAGLARVAVRIAGRSLVLPLMTSAEADELLARLGATPRPDAPHPRSFAS